MMRLAALLFAVILAGCASSPQSRPPENGSAPSRDAQVFVALVDTGINPWHEAFRSGLEDSPVLPVPYTTAGEAFKAKLELEGPAAWREFSRGQLVWFEGTRVLAVSQLTPAPPGAEPILLLFPPDSHPIYDDADHGTAVASVLASTSPHAWIVMVETNAPSLDGYLWANQQVWIDIISTSRGAVGHTPANTTDSDPDAYAAASRAAVESGKIFVAAGGNQPDPNFYGSESGPPWVISVGGADGDNRGVTVETSRPTDVVTNYTAQGVARNSSNTETYTAVGTSMGAPLVAGVLAEALYQLRSQSGHAGGIVDDALVRTSELMLTNADLRDALNRTAAYWDPAEFAPGDVPLDNPLQVSPTMPALPAAGPVGPWVQMGWGFVDGSTVDDIVAALTGAAPPQKPPEAVEYMAHVQAAREAYWDQQ